MHFIENGEAPLKTFKPKEFLESISPKVLLTDINKTQKKMGEIKAVFIQKPE